MAVVKKKQWKQRFGDFIALASIFAIVIAAGGMCMDSHKTADSQKHRNAQAFLNEATCLWWRNTCVCVKPPIAFKASDEACTEEK